MPNHRMSKWFSWGEEQISLAPEKSGAYELAYKDTIVYIGSAETSIKSRLCSHRKRKSFMKVTHFRFQLVEWSTDARKLEAKLCEEFKKNNGGKLPRLQGRAPKLKKSIWDI